MEGGEWRVLPIGGREKSGALGQRGLGFLLQTVEKKRLWLPLLSVLRPRCGREAIKSCRPEGPSTGDCSDIHHPWRASCLARNIM